MWVRQCDLDPAGESPPIPTPIASNEEFVPPPQSAEQRAVEARATELGEQNARRLGLSRRTFFRTGAGLAAGLIALNEVFGPCYDVRAEEAADPQAFAER